jgi:hypothetical protein
MYIVDNWNNRIRFVTMSPCPPAAVAEVQAAAGTAAVFPNPATSVLTITAPYKISAITISNLLGQVVASPGPSPHRLSLSAGLEREMLRVDVSGLPSGIYFVKIIGADNYLEVRKFVKE